MSSVIPHGNEIQYSLCCSQKSSNLFDTLLKNPADIHSRTCHLKLFIAHTVTLSPVWDIVRKILDSAQNVLVLISEVFGKQDPQILKYRGLRIILLDPLHILALTAGQVTRFAATFLGIFSPTQCIKGWKAAENLEERILLLKQQIWNKCAHESKEEVPQSREYKKIVPRSYLVYQSPISFKQLWNPENALMKKIVSTMAQENFKNLIKMHPYNPPFRSDYADQSEFSKARVRYINQTINVIESNKPIPSRQTNNNNPLEIYNQVAKIIKAIVGIFVSNFHSKLGEVAAKIEQVTEEEILYMLPQILPELPSDADVLIKNLVSCIKLDLAINSQYSAFYIMK